MTTAYERTKSVIETRKFLQMLASAEEITIQGLVQSVALCLLRHYPLDVDLEVSAAALPGVWATSEREGSGGTVVPKQTCPSFVTGQRNGSG
jgi:hypothetical protein